MSAINLRRLAGRTLALVTGAALFLVVGLATAAEPTAGAGANAIESVSVSTHAGRLALKVSLKDGLKNPPAGFALTNPPRIALDFPDTSNGLGKNLQEVNQGELKTLNIVQAGSRTRLVLNLAKNVSYDTKVEGKDVYVMLSPVSAATASATASPVTSRFAEPNASSTKHDVRDVDFRRGRDGQGRVMVDLSDAGAGIDIRLQGKSIVVDFLNTGMAKQLERRLDVIDFGTPVQFVEAYAQGNNVRLVVEPKGKWEHSAYQADNRFILEVKPVTDEEKKRAGKAEYTGDKLSLNFQNVEVRAVLQVLADFTGLNIITSDTVGGNLTLRLKDVPWDQALDIIMQSKGLDLRKNGNVVLIAPRDELATKEKLELEARQQLSELEPTQTESFQLNYQKAEDVKKILSDDKQKILSKRGSVVVDPRTNILFVQDTASKLEEIRRLITKIDVSVRQVMIEARIVEANDNFAKNLGVRLGATDLSQIRGVGAAGTTIPGTSRRVLVGGNVSSVGVQNGQQANTDTSFLPDSLMVNLPAPTIGASPAGVFTLSIFNNKLTRFLNLEVSALESDGKGKVVSSPRVVTADQVEAIIEQGTEIPYQEASSSGATSVSFKKAVLSLKVKPQITPDGNVIMNVKVNKDSVDRTIPTPVPAIDTKQIQTQVLVENGGTVVIGGIYQQTENEQATKVPVLGDLPYVGFMFRQKTKVDNKQELLIFITPRILNDSVGRL